MGALGKIRKKRMPVTYADQTYGSPYWIVRWPHQERYRRATEAIVAGRPRTILDYGAGDAHLLREIVARGGGWFPERVVLLEPSEEYRVKAAQTIAELGVGDRVEVVADVATLHSFDLVVCLGVLEHLPLPERACFYAVCRRALADGGQILIDVPSEVGLTVLVKELGRRLLKGRPPEFSTGDLLRYSLGAVQFDPARWDPENDATSITYHTGFDHRLLEKELAYHFRIIESFRTPLPRLPAWLGNQEIFFVAEAR